MLLAWDWNWNLSAWSCFFFLLMVTMNGDDVTTEGIGTVVVSSNCGWMCSKGAESAIPLSANARPVATQ